MENEKLVKLKIWEPGKIDYLGSHVFENAKILSIFYICYFQIAKCFCPKSKIILHPIKKISKLHLKIVADRQNLKPN